MQRMIRCSAFVALTVLGVAACADSVAPPRPGATPAPVFDVIAGNSVCKPCPPGSVCAAVCEPISIEIVVPYRR
jgi:hypothetical protein